MDKNPEAVRVACFSLYLAMADAIEPKHLVAREGSKVFPRLRGTRLLHQDFFDEEAPGLRAVAEREPFDLVLGNAPWGDGSIFPDKLPDETKADYRKRIKPLPPTSGQKWAKANQWPVANNDIGPLFLGKAAMLTKPAGFVAMVNTASLLYWRHGKATELRKKLFTSFTFAEVTNLSALRHELFPQAIGPSCIVVFNTEKPDGQRTLHYYTPKPTRALKLQRGFSIEPTDIALLSHSQAHEIPWAWSALALGGNRHLSLAQRYSNFPSLEKLEAQKKLETRKGVIPGNRELLHPEQAGKPILLAADFPADVFVELDSSALPPWSNPRTASSDSKVFLAFRSPQILIKLSYAAELGRMRAVRVKKHPVFEETLCQGAFVSCHDLADDERHIRAALTAFNSSFAVVFFALTSTSFPFHTCKLTVKDLLKLPIPAEPPDASAFSSYAAIDEAARRGFG